MSSRILRLLSLCAAVFIAIIGVAVTHSALAAPTLRPVAQGNPYVEVCTWLNCKAAAISYSQDDAGNIQPGSANSCQTALENAGLQGTFFYDGDTSPSWLTTLSNAGHEVGSHLVSHSQNCADTPSCGPTCTLTLETFLQISYTIAAVNNFRQTQLDPNIAAIEARTGKPVVSMAYACGNTDPRRMAAAEQYFLGARGYYHQPAQEGGGVLPWVYDINAPTPSEFMLLNADWYFHQALVDSAVNEGGWEIVTVHDYCEGINTLRNISDTVWIAPVGDVLKYIRVRNAAQITDYVRAGYAISFTVAHNLPAFQRQQLNGAPLLPITYDNPVTLRARIDSAANVIGVQADGTNLTYTVDTISGTRYVWFNTPLTPTQHIVIQGDGPLAVGVAHLSATPSSVNATPALIAAGGAGICLLIVWKQRQRHRYS